MPGFNFSVNVGFDEPTTEEKRPIDGPARAPTWPALESPKVKFTLLAALGMCAEAGIAFYFLLGVISNMRFVGIHGLVISVLGVPWALFFAFVTKKAQQEIREAARHTTAVDVPPSYETVAAVPMETAPVAPKTLSTQNI